MPEASTDLYADLAARLTGIPTWIFHGDVDRVVPVEESRRMAATLEGAGADVRRGVRAGPRGRRHGAGMAQAQAPGRFTLEHLFDSVPPPRRPQTNIHREREPSGMPLCMPELYCYVSSARNP